MKIQVIFASQTRQQVLDLTVPTNTTARNAVLVTKLSDEFPEIDFATAPLGIYGKQVPDEHLLTEGDRVEIYRPLFQSPTEARRRRAKSMDKPRNSG